MRRFREAIPACEASLRLHENDDLPVTGDPLAKGRALNSLGTALYWADRYRDSIAAHERAVALLRGAGHELAVCGALTDLGVALRGARRFEEAISAHERSVAIARKAGHSELETIAAQDLERTQAARDGSAQDDPGDVDASHRAGDVLNDRGLSLLRSGRFEEAEAAFREAVAVFQRLGDRRDEGVALNNVGLCFREQGRHDQAIEILDRALTLVENGTTDRELAGGIAHDLGVALTNQGIAFVERRRFGDAASACEQAVAIFRDAEDRAREAMALDGQGRALAMVHRLDDAIAAHQAAAEATLDPRRDVGEVLMGVAPSLRGGA